MQTIYAVTIKILVSIPSIRLLRMKISESTEQNRASEIDGKRERDCMQRSKRKKSEIEQINKNEWMKLLLTSKQYILP